MNKLLKHELKQKAKKVNNINRSDSEQEKVKKKVIKKIKIDP